MRVAKEGMSNHQDSEVFSSLPRYQAQPLASAAKNRAFCKVRVISISALSFERLTFNFVQKRPRSGFVNQARLMVCLSGAKYLKTLP